MKHLRLILALALPVMVVSCKKDASAPMDFSANVENARATTGNGAPSGAHFTLNIIGVSKDKKALMQSSDYDEKQIGRRIFADFMGKTRIMLTEGAFAVLDANGTDGEASFRLPKPDADYNNVSDYSAYVRALGKPGGSATIVNCATLTYDMEWLGLYAGDEYCETATAGGISLERTAGGSKFVNVTRDLLYVQIDIDGDGDIDNIPLFDSRLENYLWEYDNNGLKLVQIRFYPVGTNVQIITP